jgi:hypothetical protein
VSQRILRSHWDRCIRFCGLIETAESASTVSLRLLNPLPQSHWDRQIHFRGLIETAESASAVSFKPQSGFPGLIETAEANNFKRLSRICQTFWHSFVLKTICLCINNVVEICLRILRSHWNRGICFRGLIETAEEASAVSLRQLKPTISNDFLEFLGNFEALFEPALSPESEP